MGDRLPHLTSRLQGFGTTIFAEMTALAVANDAVNLGQGFPDFDGPAEVAEVAVQAIRDGRNQYAPGHGVKPLREAIVDHQQRFHGLTYDPDTEVTVSAGATEAICATLQALCEVGDEVIAFEPYYDSYAASIAMVGAVRVPVTLRAPDFSFDPQALEEAVTAKTRAILVNSPHNPTGKVFSREELEQVAEVCRRHDLIAITDEVYEHLVYDVPHVPLASLDGMRERTVTISSAAKTFSFTGWKVGWLCAPSALTAAVRTAKQFMTYANGTPLQFAIAHALRLPDDYFTELATGYRARRDRLVTGLHEVGFEVYEPAGTYFASADIRPFGYLDGMQFCLDLPSLVGVAAVPHVVFYDDKAAGRPFVRFAFCKSDEVLAEGIRRLHGLRPVTDPEHP